jgi:hypothetical protein
LTKNRQQQFLPHNPKTRCIHITVQCASTSNIQDYAQSARIRDGQGCAAPHAAKDAQPNRDGPAPVSLRP